MKPVVRYIQDLRGLVLHSYYACEGNPTDTVRDKKGELRPAASEGVDFFIRNYLIPVFANHAPVNVIGVLEGKDGNARRRNMYEQYKAKPSQDEDDEIVSAEKLKALEAVQKLMLGLGCILVKTPYCEADDTIAYLCERLHGGKIVQTVDGDLLQLYKPDSVALVIRDKYMSEYKGKMKQAYSLDEYNFVALYKSICGDTSDGYVGVRGLGPTAFEELITRYGMDGLAEIEQCVATAKYDPIIEALQSNHCKPLEKLYMARDEWELSYRLAKTHPEWCERVFGKKGVAPQWAKRIPSMERILAVLEPMGLAHHAETVKKFMPRKWLADKQYFATQNSASLLKAMKESRFVAFDYESYDSLKHPAYQEAKPGYVDVLSQKITGASFCFGSNFQYCFYVPTQHRDTRNVDKGVIKDFLVQMMDAQQTIIAHNNAFELTVSYTNFDGLELRGMLDSMIMASYVNENDALGLKYRSKKELNYDQINYKEVVGDGDMRDVSGAEVLDYGCDDSIVAAHLTVLYNVIMECEQTWDNYEQNEPYFERALLRPFVKGIPLDYEKLAELRAEDDKLHDDTYAILRGLLEEHCSEINHEGYLTLWEEIEPFERAKLEKKGREKLEKDSPEATDAQKTSHEIAWDQFVNAKLEEKKNKLIHDCKYNPIRAPVLCTIKKDLGLIAKCLCLPPLRSIKPDWLQVYAIGIEKQVESGADITPDQQTFVGLLKAAASMDVGAINALESWINAYAQTRIELYSGDQLNAGSPDQMARLFYGKMGLPILLRNIDKDESSQRSQFALPGAPSTNENAIRTWMTTLSKESWQYKVLECILTIRLVRTRRSFYYNPYPLWKSPVDGRTHPQIKNCGTRTRRPSSTAYNIFQVSKTRDDGKIRSVFLPQSPDELIVSIDFVQEELVIGAGESGDPNLRACYTGEVRRDVHTLTGWQIYNERNKGYKPPISYEEFQRLVEEGDKDATVIRKVYAKRTNFLEFYGGGPAGMARKIIVSLEMAQAFDRAFHAAYPRVRDYQKRCAEFVAKHGFIKTCFGGRRHLPGIYHKNDGIKASAERQAGNFPIQGGAGEILKRCMRGYVLGNVESICGSTIYGPIYDEFVSSVPISNVFKYCDIMADIMEMELPGLDIKLSTSVSIGRNWGDQIELGTRPSKELIEKTIQEIMNSELETEAA